MALVRVQATSGKDTTFASSCSTTAFASPLTVGSLILVAVEFDTGAVNSVTSITDTAGNIYYRILSKNETGIFNLEMWYTQNIQKTTSNIVTATDNSGGVNSVICAEEWTGQQYKNPIDVYVSANDGSSPGTTLNSGSASQSNYGNEVVWCAGAVSLGSNALTLGSGFSNLTQNSTTSSCLGIENKTVIPAGTYNGTFTASGATSWCCGAVMIIPSIITQQVITATGSGSFTVPAGVTSVTVELWGGGGSAGTGTSGSACGGGSGAYVVQKNLSVTPGNNITYVIGAGGSGGVVNISGGTGGTGFAAGGNGASGSVTSGGGGGGSSSVVVSGTTYIASGGGGGSSNSAPTNTSSTGSSGGAGGDGNAVTRGGGGGGGSNTIGNNAVTNTGGTGGTGGTNQNGTGGFDSTGNGYGGSAAGISGNGNNSGPVAGSSQAGNGSGGATGGTGTTGVAGTAGSNSDSGGGGGLSVSIAGTGGAGGQPGAGGGICNQSASTGGAGGAGKLIITYNAVVTPSLAWIKP